MEVETSNQTEITRILRSLQDGDNHTDALIPLVYDELKLIAANRLAMERPGMTLQATALVHEAYLRLQRNSGDWENHRHFFSAAAEAMRRILIDNARKRKTIKRGQNPIKDSMDIDCIEFNPPNIDLLDLNDALDDLESVLPSAAEMVKLKFFVGLTIQQAADSMDISLRKANNLWAFARAWLYRRLK